MTTSNESRSSNPILVLGGTGKVGRRVLANLKAAGVPTRLGSRSASPAFEWTDRSTWPQALAGVKAVFISYVPDLSVDGATDDIAAFIEQAQLANVEKLVLLSGRGEPEAQRCEQLVKESGLKWTICRAGWFMQNFTESFMLEPVLDGTLAFPGGSMVEPWIDCDDIAAVATAALVDDAHDQELYDLTGPELLSFADMAKILSEATGRTVQYVPLALDTFVAELRAAHLPEDLVQLMRYLFGEVFDGRNAHLGDGVQRALGRKPRSFADFALQAVAQGLWSPEVEDRS